jgi:cytidylate kinase
MKPIIVAIDGYSSCGKSTLAKALAKKMQYAYVDTGAMYRAVSLFVLRNDLDLTSKSESEIDAVVDQIEITFRNNNKTNQSETYLNGENVEEEIRGKEVSQAVSEISQIKQVRKRMIDLQQKGGESKQLIMDGRDIGTKVFPNAEVKLFMTADPDIRAQRRFDELKGKGKEVSLEEVKANLNLRDYNDTHRKENPLTKAKDAVEIDNSFLNEDEQLNLVLRIIEEKVSN